ncbi:short-chain dehydrogenase [Virgisporangium aliadipatigenens]|uniref:Short-chain dehydrogenase n=1 Tax=Virgisporangium aliadipatigenens TaxID=741659 RepID=A0A8J3YMI6_9ACTN|nr:SDR family NAD(P)-dependent oxidoreductase [Virgisporangium aliadipatigenens]GIJ46833.1 short-chain dehydrogenase [Virgisporangium aliadipatigenens]
MPTTVVLGAGPGLGMSIAHRFGREGHRVALVSRDATRHAGYLASLAAAGVDAEAFVADVRDRAQLLSTLDTLTERQHAPEVVYYGPSGLDPETPPTMRDITRIDADDARDALSWLYPAIDVVGAVLPGMVARGGGALLFAGGVSAVTPMPMLGAMALHSAALRNYALTLNAALAPQGVYAGTLTIGGLIARGDIHALVTSDPRYGVPGTVPTLDPDALADTLWDLATKRDRPEAVANVVP